jgi:uncharacterized iron-regulated membrane protein
MRGNNATTMREQKGGLYLIYNLHLLSLFSLSLFSFFLLLLFLTVFIFLEEMNSIEMNYNEEHIHMKTLHT